MPWSDEYRDACLDNSYAQCLKRLVKRRRAVCAARPFSVSSLGNYHEFIYANGVVICARCEDGEMKIWRIDRSQRRELRINMRKLFLKAVPGVKKAKFEYFDPLYHANGFISVIYTVIRAPTLPSQWLVAWHLSQPLNGSTSRLMSKGKAPKQRPGVFVQSLESSKDIFVRNDTHWLYYGTRLRVDEYTSHPGALPGEFDEADVERWVLHALNLHSGEWKAERIILWDLRGSSIGQDVCFEIFDGYFYGISSETELDPVVGGWNSFYHVFPPRLRDPAASAPRTPGMASAVYGGPH